MGVKKIIPVKVRKFLLQLHQQYFWKRAIKTYQEQINNGKIPDTTLLRQLVYGWGNQGFSAQINYMETCIANTMNSEGLIFECGSGLSTILIGCIAKKQGRKMVSFEHFDFWGQKVQKELLKNNLNYNQIYIRSLKDYGNFDWYDTTNFSCEKIGLCICDAPPGNTRGGRRGFVYLFKDHFLPHAKILVDDTIREDEQLMIKEWQTILPMDVVFSGSNDPHAILTLS